MVVLTNDVDSLIGAVGYLGDNSFYQNVFEITLNSPYISYYVNE